MNKDFNKEMDKYLLQRREYDTEKYSKPKNKGNNWWKKIITKKIPSEFTPREETKLNNMEEEMIMLDNIEEKVPEEEYEIIEKEKENLFKKFIGFFRLYERKHKLDDKAEQIKYVEEEIIPKIDDDVKEVLKIIHKWLEKLPPKEKGAFKRSNDFKKYKALLKKYDLTK